MPARYRRLSSVSEITEVHARQILDSRGHSTIEVDIITEDGFGRAAAPSGASTGIHEVQSWPDGGVAQALAAANGIVGPELIGANAADQRGIDELLETLDGTPNFARLGGNLAVAVSLAVARAAADGAGMPLFRYLGGAMVERLPRPFGNVLGGGAHAVGGTDIQEFMAVSLGPTFSESAFANALVHKKVKERLKKDLPTIALGKGDEGAWVAPVANEIALKIVSECCTAVQSEVGFDVRVALDVAATELYKDGVYTYKDRRLKPQEQVDFLAGLVEDYNLFSIEDPLAEDDWESWTAFTCKVADRCLVVGDDLFTTNPERILRGINSKAANALLVKPNQIGTLSRTIDAVNLAHEQGWQTIVSHRSGETTDATIAHLAAAFGSIGIKTGAVGGERIAKLNELIRIEEEL
ncbi:MAG: phosphopyruvate hydratase [Thermoplasmatota archaeon]